MRHWPRRSFAVTHNGVCSLLRSNTAGGHPMLVIPAALPLSHGAKTVVFAPCVSLNLVFNLLHTDSILQLQERPTEPAVHGKLESAHREISYNRLEKYEAYLLPSSEDLWTRQVMQEIYISLVTLILSLIWIC